MAAPISGFSGIGATNPIGQDVSPIAAKTPKLPSAPPELSPGAKSPDFGQTLADAITGARGAEANANDQAARFANGDPSVGMHEVMIASEKANIQVRYAVTLKNRILEAYKEIMNTPV